MPLPETMTAVELGELLGISGRSVRDLVSRGVIQKAGKGRYPVRGAVKGYTSHLRETAALRGGDDATSAARRREAEARALKVELANRRALGELVEAGEVRTRWVALCTAARSRLMAIPSRLGARMGLKTADMRIVEIEIRQALEEMADGAGTDRG